MAKHETTDSESEDASSSSGSEDSQTVGNEKKKEVSEYEKQRLSRIAENRARLEALGLPQMAATLKGSSKPHSATKGKEKKKVQEDDDDEYLPEEERELASCSSSEQDDDHKDQDFAIQNPSGSRKRKMKRKGLKKKAIVSGKSVSISEYVDYDDDEALRQAIALSLQDSVEGSCLPDKNAVKSCKTGKKGQNDVQEDKGRKKNKKSFASRLQLTEDELIVHFFQLDEAGKGTLSVRDIQRAATAHDFLWTDKELVDMIRYFDSDGDGKLSLDDFRKIVVRCNLIKES